MMLPAYFRIPYDDELLYGWLKSVAETNFPMDYRCVQRLAGILFRESKAPQARGIVSKEPVRTDFMRGMDSGVMRIRNKGFIMPDVDVLLARATPLPAVCVSKSQGEQGRYVHTALADVHGSLMDMPKLPLLVKKIQVCPLCMKKKPYLRTWHHLPGVTVCAVHRVPLVPIEEAAIQKKNERLPGTDEAGLKINSDAVAYAVYAKEIYDNPSEINPSIIARYLQENGFPISSKEMSRLRKDSVPFPDVVRMLVARDVKYKDMLSFAKKYAAVNEQWFHEEGIVSYISPGCGGLTGCFKCEICGYEWTDSPSAVKNIGCPECLKAKNPDDVIAGVLRRIGDGRYRLTEPFRGMGSTQEVMHDTCGRAAKVRMASRIWNSVACRCEMGNSVRELAEKLHLEEKGFTITGYTPTTEKLTLIHNPCGHIRRIGLQQAKRQLVCRYCQDTELDDKACERLSVLLGGEYTVDEFRRRGHMNITHCVCGKSFTATYKQLMNGRRCALCTSFMKEKRNTPSYESLLYLEMQEWFQNHTLWIAKRHRIGDHGKKYYDALQVLVKKGYIYRAAYGMYANTSDLNIYQILEAKYLVDDEGCRVGHFTGDTAAYLAGIARDEPDVITLESTLLTRKYDCIVHINGRDIVVRGI